MIGPGLEGRVEARPACTEKLRQALLGQAEVQPRQRAERPFALPLALPGYNVAAIGFLRAGDLPDDMLLHQTLEGPDIGNLEEDEVFGVLLQPDQDIALDVAQLEQRILHAALRAMLRKRRQPPPFEPSNPTSK